MSFEGFCFNFEEDGGGSAAPALFGATPFLTKSVTNDAAVVSVPRLPVYSLTPQLLRKWHKQNENKTLEKMEIKCCGGGADVYSLLYQSAPSLAELTVTDDNKQRDIIPGKYYGGLKIWSCAPYLVEYMFTNQHLFRDLFSADKNRFGDFAPPPPPQSSLSFCDSVDPVVVVVEIGCGQGLPGIAALLLGARHVIFQDYNKEVLDLCVGPNIAANLLRVADGVSSPFCDFLHQPNVQFVSGDWSHIKWEEQNEMTGEKAREVRCNVALGSDVTFDEEACEKLAAMLWRCLSPANSVAYIASKRYYFGTHGGALEFQRCAESYGLKVAEVSRVDEFGGMQRLIMRVNRNSQELTHS